MPINCVTYFSFYQFKFKFHFFHVFNKLTDWNNKKILLNFWYLSSTPNRDTRRLYISPNSPKSLRFSFARTLTHRPNASWKSPQPTFDPSTSPSRHTSTRVDDPYIWITAPPWIQYPGNSHLSTLSHINFNFYSN